MPASCSHHRQYLAVAPDVRCVSCGAHTDVRIAKTLTLAAAVLRTHSTGATSAAATSAVDLESLAELFGAGGSTGSFPC